jgi:PAS domain S-box-containing protein
MASHERQANGSIFWDGLLLDISNRKEIESALRESESRFRGIFERAPIGMAIVDLNFGLKSCNQAYRDLLGRKESEIRNLQLKDFTHPDDLAENLRLQSRLGRGEIEEYSLEKRFIRKNGEIRWGHLTSCLLRDSNGSPLGFLGHVLDVTDQKQADERLRQMAKMEAVGRLAGGVAHDFNNMLGVILGRVDMLLEEIKPGQPFYDDLNEIRQAGARSADLTRQLLAFARKQTVSPRVIDINQTVNGMLKMLQRLIGENIEMEWIPGGNVWEVKIDPAQIDQLLVNLCVNARDAIAGLGKVVIETRNTVFDEDYCKDHEGFTPGEFAVIAVSDNGRGMDAETQSHLFEPFFTTKDQGKGTGLGLATVYGVVKQNNGFINVYSEPDHGTTFKIYLPRHNASSGTQPAKTPIKSWERGQGTILLVEDEPAILKMTSLMLERLGYVVVGTSTPRDAIRLATEHAGDIHLLITDVVMPEMNGRDLAKNILSLYPSLKCLFMSGYTASVIADHGVLNEGVNFIQKPFSKADLAAKVREVLAQK